MLFTTYGVSINMFFHAFVDKLISDESDCLGLVYCIASQACNACRSVLLLIIFCVTLERLLFWVATTVTYPK